MSRAAPRVAPTEIAALVPDRAEREFPEADHPEQVEVGEDDLDRLVRVFYARAQEDAVLGPVFQEPRRRLGKSL